MTQPIGRVAGVFLRRDIGVALSHRFPFILDVAGVFFSALTFSFVARIVDDPGLPADYFTFALLGLTLTVFMNAGISLIGGAVRQEQLQGTLEPLMSLGLPSPALAAGFAAYPLVYGSIVGAAYLVVGAFLGWSPESANWGLAITSLATGVVAFVGIGLAGLGAVLVFRRAGGILSWVITLLALAGGELFPPDLLPGWVRSVSAFSPYTRCLDLLRSSLLQGMSWRDGIVDLGSLVAITLACGGLGMMALNLGIHVARRRGLLGGY